jgi:hypothetical protein
MPAKLAAPTPLLTAIFAQTNTLSHDDRRDILTFLAGSTRGEGATHLGGNGIRQILLNEERHPTHTNESGATPPETPPNMNAANTVPTTIMSTNNSSTTVDQIIFEMDYSNGCWRKLRRRIRSHHRSSQGR